MSRILAIDYGLKRTGLAVTDPFKIIATGLTTIPSDTLIAFLKNFFLKENVELIIIGYPRNLDDSETHGTALAEQCIKQLMKAFPGTPVRKVDERYTSKLAVQSMVQSGMKKKDRRNKALVDEIAATIMLQEYLQHPGLSDSP